MVTGFGGDGPGGGRRCGVDDRSILTYSQSENPDSPYYADQTRLFSDKRWVDVPYCESEIAADPALQVTPLNGGYVSPGAPAQPSPSPDPTVEDCTIVGTAGKDKLKGTSGDDVICAGGGGDVIRGKGGDDTIFGWYGQDRLAGGPGEDSLHGENGRDRLRGGQGIDILDGGPGNDNSTQ